MLTKNFQQVLVEVKSEMFVRMTKLELPKVESDKTYATPFLRRRLRRRMGGFYG